ncbi:hypothetical protein M8J76_009864 [Diaphorina citri]|nr:hypothetical protein M8J76_003439 [Diaphorina citri]KAI5733271.1 hypothetical protein M8J76_009864 [Diaphorina citri]
MFFNKRWNKTFDYIDYKGIKAKNVRIDTIIIEKECPVKGSKYLINEHIVAFLEVIQHLIIENGRFYRERDMEGEDQSRMVSVKWKEGVGAINRTFMRMYRGKDKIKSSTNGVKNPIELL